MEKLRTFINSLDAPSQDDFAVRCGTSIGYIRKAISIGQTFGESLCINFERESNGVVRCEELRDDVDWAYLRGTRKRAA